MKRLILLLLILLPSLSFAGGLTGPFAFNIADAVAGYCTSITGGTTVNVDASCSPTWSGSHTWLSPLLAPDGAAATPAYSFSGHSDAGLYWNGGFEAGVGVVVGGAPKVEVGPSTAAIIDNLAVNGIANIGDGITNAVQLTVLGNGAQTANLADFNAGDGNDLLVGPEAELRVPAGSNTDAAIATSLHPEDGFYFQNTSNPCAINGSASGDHVVACFFSNSIAPLTLDNTIDIGTAARKFATGHFGTAVISPMQQLTPTASPPAACAGGTEGEVYSDTSHALCWCDGTTWQKLSGAGTCS
jgi:hypothetical protein